MSFLRKSRRMVRGLTLGAATAVTLAMPAQAEPVKLAVQVAWPLTLPASGRDAQHFADVIKTASRGDVDIKLYPAGALVPPLEIFDAVQRGTLDAGYTSPLYAAGKFPAVQLFGGVPFGPDAVGYVGWLYNGGGLDIWREIYGEQGVMVVPCGLMAQEAGGWYKEPIESVEDFKGLKLRFSGVAGEVMKKMGASVVLLAGGDIFPNLERGVIDGTEFSMPAIDRQVGFDQVVKNYYVPGWHQPAAINELIINKAKWDAMDDSQRQLIELTCRETMLWGLSSTYIENGEALEAFAQNGVEIRAFSPEVLAEIEQVTKEVMEEQAAKDADFARVWQSLSDYRSKAALWEENRR